MQSSRVLPAHVPHLVNDPLGQAGDDQPASHQSQYLGVHRGAGAADHIERESSDVRRGCRSLPVAVLMSCNRLRIAYLW